jgi:hypothetical protein
MTLQAAEKLDNSLFCNKGTTLVGPQVEQYKERALAPEVFFPVIHLNTGLFPQPV